VRVHQVKIPVRNKNQFAIFLWDSPQRMRQQTIATSHEDFVCGTHRFGWLILAG
jgi:hypothetical protein